MSNAASRILKKKHFRVKHQKVKLFRANEPLLSVLMWGVNHTVSHLRILSSVTNLFSAFFTGGTYLKGKLNYRYESNLKHLSTVCLSDIYKDYVGLMLKFTNFLLKFAD